MKIVVLCMTRQEKGDFVARCGSFTAFSNFWENLPDDTDLDGLLEGSEEKCLIDKGHRLDDVELFQDPATDEQSIFSWIGSWLCEQGCEL